MIGIDENGNKYVDDVMVRMVKIVTMCVCVFVHVCACVYVLCARGLELGGFVIGYRRAPDMGNMSGRTSSSTSL